MSETKYILGYDLNDYVSQISYYELNQQIPEALPSGATEERLGIPTVLSKRKGVSQWEYGINAQRAAALGNASLVANMLSLATTGAKLELEGEAYEAAQLLLLFVRRSLNLLSMLMTPEQVELMVITVESLEGKLMDVVEMIASNLPIPRERIILQTYEESIFYYMLHQPEALWERDVAVFDYSGTGIKAYALWMNTKTQPIVAFVDRTNLCNAPLPDSATEREASRVSAEKMQQLDAFILEQAREYFAGKNIGTVFLLGEGFEGGWCEQTLKYLCKANRVFQGRNLYSKGACYAGHDKVFPVELNENYVFLGVDKLKFNLGVKVILKGEEEYVALADAGVNWYESDSENDFVLGEDKEINLVITPLDGKDPQEVTVELNGIPDRPPRASRVRLAIEFNSETSMILRVSDLGFGEFYPATDKTWEKIVDLSQA